MFIFIKTKRLASVLSILIVMTIVLMFLLFPMPQDQTALAVDDSTEEKLALFIDHICEIRNNAILEGDLDTIRALYDTEKRNGLYAYEHEVKKTKYLINWSDKQGVKFTDIQSYVSIKWSKATGKGYTVNLFLSTAYKYVYLSQPDAVNTMRIGTYHEMDLATKADSWLITREWYTDPFADSLDLNKLKTNEIDAVIQSRDIRVFLELETRRRDAVQYADRYVGAADSGENDYSYNPKYKDYNSVGGDCANFVSQILYEAGKFKQNKTWGYYKDGTLAWLKAQSLKNYLLYSGRGSLIASGSYGKVLQASYKLLPGDVVAYESKGKITHVSIVTGADSKGYTLVNCHNTDRYRVPWDLGWSNTGVKFYFIRVHY